MKYLKTRSHYLQIVKERNDLQITEKMNLILENQAGSGVMGNEIKWGDCLLGRFLHNTIRKAQIGANLARIRPVISRLRGAMDDLLVSEQLNDLSEVDKAELNKALASEYIDVLQQAIDDFPTAKTSSLYYTFESIQNLVSDTIEKLKGTTATPYLGTGFEGKNEILRQLTKFKEVIDEWVEYKVPKKDTNTTPPNRQQVNPQQNALNAYQTNLFLLLQLIQAWGKINRLRAKIFALQQAKQAVATAQTPQEKQAKEADVAKVEAEIKQIIDESYDYSEYDSIFESDVEEKILQREKELTEQWIESQKKAGKTNFKPGEGTRIRLRKQAEQEVKTGKPATPTNSPTQPNDKDVKPQSMIVETPIVKIMKQLWSIFLPRVDKEKSVGNQDYIRDWMMKLETESKEDKQSQVQIRKIYDAIRKKLGLTNEDSKNESVMSDILNDTEKIAELILNLYNSMKTTGGVITIESAGIKIPDAGVAFKSNDLKDKIKEEFREFSEISRKFYTNMTEECLVEKLYVAKEIEVQGQAQGQAQAQKETKVKESKLFKYSDFILEYLDGIDNTNPESQETKDLDPDKQHPPGDNRGKRIYTVGPDALKNDRDDLATDLKAEWNKVLPGLGRFIISGKAQIEQLKETLNKKLASQKDSIIIMGMDPVLEIVKCFNRAYKIHTTQVIPSGRTGGAVTNKIFMEYTCFGSGTPQNAGEGGGPYRNNKLFDLWESSVMDIMKDKQYQKIFNNATRLKVGDEYIEKAGANLRKFMNDMLNGDELYGKGDGKEGGAQAKFLDKYFGYKDGDDAKNTNFGGTEEREANMANTPEPMNIVLEEPNKERDWKLNDLKYTFFAIKAQEQGTTYTMIFFVQDIDVNTGELVVSYCQSAYHMKKILGSVGQTVKLSTDFTIDDEKSGTEPYPICATKIKISDFIDQKGITKNVIARTVNFVWHEGCDSNKREDKCNEWDSPVVSARKNWSAMKYYNIIDKSKGDTGERAKAPRVDKIDEVIKLEGGFINKDIKNLVGNNKMT